jgi:hypothetical protein
MMMRATGEGVMMMTSPSSKKMIPMMAASTNWIRKRKKVRPRDLMACVCFNSSVIVL